jgi:putative ABC transport system substrate-binding protein
MMFSLEGVKRIMAVNGRLSRILFALAVGILLPPLEPSAQTPAKVYRIGFLYTSTQPQPPSANDLAFREELRKRGYVEGENLVVERRDAASQIDRLPAIAKELVALRPDLIVASGPQATRAVKNATSTVPIVMIGVADPIETKLALSLARPGENLTGVATLVPGGIMGKSLQYLHQAVPKATDIGMLVNPTNDVHRVRVPLEIPDAERQLGVQIHAVEARTTEEIEPAINRAVGKRVDALFIQGDPVFSNPADRVPKIVARTGLPAIYFSRAQVEAGGLMSFGPDQAELWRRAASYVDRILKGENPADMPIEQPTKMDLVINLTTAKALGLTIPQSLRIGAVLIE